MENTSVSIESFELNFLKHVDISTEDFENEDEMDETEIREQLKEQYLKMLPDTAVFIGAIETEVSNFGTYEYSYEFYVVPIDSDGYSWALIKFYWDDNWSKWNWDAKARMKGENNPQIAAKMMFDHLDYFSWNDLMN
jgi:hypothetical protein